MTEEQASTRRYMPAEDVSDSDEEPMDESDSGADNAEQNGDGSLEPPKKRRNVGLGKRHSAGGDSEPKWSNPDPYTVLPPVDEEARKRKDVVKLIRKSDLHTAAKASQHNQVAANDDFISFGFEDDEVSIRNEAPPSPSSVDQDDYGVGESGPPSGPRQQFSHLENLHGQASEDAPGTNGKAETANSLGPPPAFFEFAPLVPEDIVVDTQLSHGIILPENSKGANASAYLPHDDGALGNRKRNHDDEIKGEKVRSRKKAGFGQANGSVLPEWVPSQNTDPVPWLRRSDHITANAGFRLHKEICDFYEFVRPRKFEQTVRQELLTRLQNVVSSHIPNCNVHSFGSFAAGLYLPNADMDVVVISNSFRSSGHKVVCQIKQQLFRFGDFIKSSGIAQKGTVEVIFGAKVPLVKFVDQITMIKVDVSFENNTGVIANDTFALWKQQFPAMPLLVTIIKQFLMMRGMNEVQHGGLGGFSVTCLVTSLLQNMPRVQSGELIPEQNLGEILIEFLDFYGNQLDTTRTGISMDPPGYFDKIPHQRPNFRGSVYQPNKAERLAIIDPNKPDNDISGGSKNVMQIFHRFARAHLEILKAMKSLNRPSLLDWSLGGNYESFVWQRDHLRKLYRQQWGTPEQDVVDIPDDHHGADVPWRGNVRPLSEMQSTVNAKMQNTGDAMSISSIVPEPPQSDHASKAKSKKKTKRSKQAANASTSTPANAKEIRKEQGRVARATALRKMFPTMQNIPNSITPAQKKGLILNHTRNAASTLQPTHSATSEGPRDAPLAPTTQATKSKNATNDEKQRNRAALLKQQYPEMEGIPPKIGKGTKKKLVAQYEAKSKAPASAVAMPTSFGIAAGIGPGLNDLPARPVPPAPTSGRYPTRQSSRLNKTPAHSTATSSLMSQRPTSYKMAPLSDERRAEVARNLAAGSNDDPVMID